MKPPPITHAIIGLAILIGLLAVSVIYRAMHQQPEQQELDEAWGESADVASLRVCADWRGVKMSRAEAEELIKNSGGNVKIVRAIMGCSP